MRYERLAAAAGVAMLIAGCGNWVEVKPQARDVAILEPAQAAHCQFLGKSEAAVLNEAGFLPRNPQAINADLVNIARNDAAKMGGNAVAPLSPRDHGNQTFGIYRCGTTALTRNPDTQQADAPGSGIKTIPYQPPR
ncbi:MAG TPA: DUF4156 domain-containing protein [Gammaproteobacteria bacterium]|nr:DUF4156 domain-containing protein [Gammaproteobacteria bacterium]